MKSNILIFQSSRCHSLRFLRLKKCEKNLGFRLSPFERYVAEKLSLSIELPVWRVTRTLTKLLYCVTLSLHTWYRESLKGKCTMRMRNSLPLYRMQPLLDCSVVLKESFTMFIINCFHIFWEEIQVRMHHVNFKWHVHFHFLCNMSIRCLWFLDFVFPKKFFMSAFNFLLIILSATHLKNLPMHVRALIRAHIMIVHMHSCTRC